jgi:hypothetical protein
MNKFIWVLVVGVVLAGCGYSGGGGVQGEVDFALENHLQETRYVNWAAGENALVSCRGGGGIVDACRFHPPGCTDECSEQNLDKDCCIACGAAYPSVKVIDPGDTIIVRWSGKLHPFDETHCSACECYRVEDAAAGTYHAEVCVHADYECTLEPCTGPDAEGIIMGASPADAPTCFGIDFTVPYTKAFLILTIE